MGAEHDEWLRDQEARRAAATARVAKHAARHALSNEDVETQRSAAPSEEEAPEEDDDDDELPVDYYDDELTNLGHQ